MSRGMLREEGSPAGPAPVLHPALSQALWSRHWLGCHDSVITPACGQVPMGTVTKEDGVTGEARPTGSAGTPCYTDQRGFHAPNPALKHGL